jgi:hypothetical protein
MLSSSACAQEVGYAEVASDRAVQADIRVSKPDPLGVPCVNVRDAHHSNLAALNI